MSTFTMPVQKLKRNDIKHVRRIIIFFTFECIISIKQKAMTNFLCPHCRGHLRVYNSIIFLTKTTKGKSALLLINPELGNYSVKMHPSYDHFSEGEVVNFICPICYENLDAEEFDKNLAKVIMQEERRKRIHYCFLENYRGKMHLPGHAERRNIIR